MTGNVARCLRGKKCHEVGDILDLAYTPQRNLPTDLLLALGHGLVEEFRLKVELPMLQVRHDLSGANGIDPDPGPSQYAKTI